MAWLGLQKLPKNRIFALKAALFVVCLAPAAELLVRYLTDDLGKEPIERITFSTGETALQMLVLVLCVTPLRRFSGWGWIQQVRRMLGLFMFFYVFAHFWAYLIDQGLDLPGIIEDAAGRLYVVVGFVAFLLLWPLALTSTNWAVKKMGALKWMKLHRAVYPVVILSVIHFLWMTEDNEYGEPLVYAAIFAILLGYRWMNRDMPKQKAPAPAGSSG